MLRIFFYLCFIASTPLWASSQFIQILEKGISKGGDVWPSDYSVIGVIIEHPKWLKPAEMNCNIEDGRRKLLTLKYESISCPECQLNKGTSLFAFYGSIPPSLNTLRLKCSHQGMENLVADLNRSKLFFSHSWASGFIKKVNWCEERVVNEISSSPERLTYKIKPPSLPIKSFTTPIGKRQRFITNQAPSIQPLFGTSYKSTAEIPIVSQIFLLPQGASIEDIRIKGIGPKVQKGVSLYPVQGGTYDHPNFKQEFKYDRQVFLNRQYSVNNALLVEPIGSSKDRLYKVVHPLVSYNPKSQTLIRYSEIQVSIDYDKSYSCYLAFPSGSPESQRNILLNQAVNQDARRKVCPIFIPPIFKPILPIIPRIPVKFKSSGSDINSFVSSTSPKSLVAKVDNRISVATESSLNYKAFMDAQLLIVYPRAFEAEVKRLMRHKSSLGIRSFGVAIEQLTSTSIIDAGSIKQALLKIYGKSTRRPQWLLLFGDSEFIPPFYFKEEPGYGEVFNLYDESYNAGDTWYGQWTADLSGVPETAVGRLPVDNLREAKWAVNKIISYEMNPSLDPEYYESRTIAASFIDNNTDGTSDTSDYAEFVEKEMLPLLNEDDKSLERLYAASQGSNPRRWSDSSPIDNRFFTDEFDWQPSHDKFIKGLNQSPIQMHRGHGWINQLFLPNITTEDLGPLKKRLTSRSPFFIGINCASGIFDNERLYTPDGDIDPQNGRADQFTWVGETPQYNGVYFGESLVKRRFGPIAYLGDTRASITHMNQILSSGLIQTLSRSPQGMTLGAIHTSGKAYLEAQYGDSNRFVLKEHQLIYNLLGDPSIQLWQNIPLTIKIIEAMEEWNKIAGKSVRQLVGKIKLMDPTCSNCLESSHLQQEILMDQIVKVVVQDDQKSTTIIADARIDKTGRFSVNLPGSYNRPNVSLTFSGAGIRPTSQLVPLVYIY